ncbi:MAG: hypothetical protein JWO83_4443 [Caulobacteraceae bacterium]|nr:hypothetical protein [Caulobacteraceae bacterium]
MKHRRLLLTVAAVSVLVGSNAHAFLRAVRFDPVNLFDFLVADPSTGIQGFSGGPVQIYPLSGYGYVFPDGVNWVDFSLDGRSITLGEGDPTGYTLTSPTPFFTVSDVGLLFTVTFPVNGGDPTKSFVLTNPATGMTTTVTESYIPEPASWALMLIGFASLGGALRVRRPKTTAAV